MFILKKLTPMHSIFIYNWIQKIDCIGINFNIKTSSVPSNIADNQDEESFDSSFDPSNNDFFTVIKLRFLRNQFVVGIKETYALSSLVTCLYLSLPGSLLHVAKYNLLINLFLVLQNNILSVFNAIKTRQKFLILYSIQNWSLAVNSVVYPKIKFPHKSYFLRRISYFISILSVFNFFVSPGTLNLFFFNIIYYYEFNLFP